jgi:hypothetical protein
MLFAPKTVYPAQIVRRNCGRGCSPALAARSVGRTCSSPALAFALTAFALPRNVSAKPPSPHGPRPDREMDRADKAKLSWTVGGVARVIEMMAVAEAGHSRPPLLGTSGNCLCGSMARFPPAQSGVPRVELCPRDNNSARLVLIQINAHVR